jgi:hypothetical protein
VNIPPNGKPVPTLQINMSGAELGGVPVTIDGNGISLNKQVAVPADEMKKFSAAFNQMTGQGLTFTPFPASVTTDETGAKVSGAAMSFRYHAPDSVPRPSDIGADEEFRLGNVTAEATARTRTAPPPVAADTALPAAGAPTAAGTLPAAGQSAWAPAPLAAALPPATVTPAGSTLSVGGPPPPTVGGSTTAGAPGEPTTLFALPTRVSSPLPGEARNGYRYVMLAAVAGAGAMLLIVRKRAL